jgi:hypothetical protein
MIVEFDLSNLTIYIQLFKKTKQTAKTDGIIFFMFYSNGKYLLLEHIF